jgi:hypothetical protein
VKDRRLKMVMSTDVVTVVLVKAVFYEGNLKQELESGFGESSAFVRLLLNSCEEFFFIFCLLIFTS